MIYRGLILYKNLRLNIEWDNIMGKDVGVSECVIVNKYGDSVSSLNEYPLPSDVEFIEHNKCSGLMKRINVSDEWDVFACPNCNLRLAVPVDALKWREIKVHLEKWNE